MSGCGGAAGALVFILFFSGASLAEKCDQNELMRCSTPLPMLSSPTDLSALNREELDNSCLELQAGIRCINNYTEHCMSPVERRRFNSMYEGVNSVMRDLCQRGSYQDSYLKHAHCIKKVKPEYEMCSKNYEITLTSVSQQRGNNNYTTDTQEAKHEEYLRTVCCSFQEYLLCSEQTVQRTCGDEAAVFTSVFLKRMASNIIKSYCLEYRGQECGMANTAARPGPGWLVLSAVLCSITAFSQLTSARENAHNVATSSLRLARALV